MTVGLLGLALRALAFRRLSAFKIRGKKRSKGRKQSMGREREAEKKNQGLWKQAQMEESAQTGNSQSGASKEIAEVNSSKPRAVQPQSQRKGNKRINYAGRPGKKAYFRLRCKQIDLSGRCPNSRVWLWRSSQSKQVARSSRWGVDMTGTASRPKRPGAKLTGYVSGCSTEFGV